MCHKTKNDFSLCLSAVYICLFSHLQMSYCKLVYENINNHLNQKRQAQANKKKTFTNLISHQFHYGLSFGMLCCYTQYVHRQTRKKTAKQQSKHLQPSQNRNRKKLVCNYYCTLILNTCVAIFHDWHFKVNKNNSVNDDVRKHGKQNEEKN